MLGPDSKFTPRQGTYLLSGVNFLASFISIATVKFVGRKPLLYLGYGGVAICHVLIGIFTLTG